MIRTAILFMGCLLLSSVALAKPFTLDETITPYQLDLAPVEGDAGAKAVSVQGSTIENGHYYYVKGHGMMQPIDVVLEAPEDRNLVLEIFLSTWTTPVRSGDTERTGLSTQQFTAYGEFGIRVAGPTARVPYLLTVYAHPEQVPDLGNPFTASTAETNPTGQASPPDAESSTPEPAASGANTASNGHDLLIYVVIGLLVIILALLAALLVRRQRSAAAVLLLVGAGGLPILHHPAQADAPTNTPEGYDTDNIRPQPGGFGTPPEAGSWGGMTSSQADEVWEGGAKTIAYLKSIKDGMDAWEAYQSLDSCMRIASPPNTPLVPSFCAEPERRVGASRSENRDDRCSTCFTDARSAFNKARLDLEKLRVIYSCTKKMSNAAIAAGDSMSGIHGYSGIIWQGLRYDIVRSVEKMEQAYDQKYPELIKNLHNSMLDMGRCEGEFGTPDWYDRIGFIYFEFMRDAYKRKD
jgi:hypothetical protein